MIAQKWGASCLPASFFTDNKPAHLEILLSYPARSSAVDARNLALDLIDGVSWYQTDAGFVLQRKSLSDDTLIWNIDFAPDFSAGQASSKFVLPVNSDWLPELVWHALLNYIAHQGLGACFHSCGLIDEDGAGYLFAGRSGAGKSTTARLWAADKRVRVLSDERIIVRQQGGQFYLYGTPWHSKAKLCQSGSAPLKGVFFLQHGAQNETLPMGSAETVAHLFSSAYPTHHNQAGMVNTLAFLASMAETLPHHRLSFLPEPDIVNFVRNLMR